MLRLVPGEMKPWAIANVCMPGELSVCSTIMGQSVCMRTGSMEQGDCRFESELENTF